MVDIVDLLQIKIEKAKSELSEETLNSISAIDWKAVILGMRTTRGYNFEQLGDLELETELVLCGLLSPEDYPLELEKRMKISKAETNDLVNEMNTLVFAKIKGELMKNAERKKIFAKKIPIPENEVKVPVNNTNLINKVYTGVLKSAGIEVVSSSSNDKLEASVASVDSSKEDDATFRPTERRVDLLKKVENPESIHPVLAQKILGSVATLKTNTDYSPVGNIKPAPASVPNKPTSYVKNADPYRLSPEE